MELYQSIVYLFKFVMKYLIIIIKEIHRNFFMRMKAKHKIVNIYLSSLEQLQ
ncbi:hypothetical protein pb186bvf_010014 [Paramecium bursaria]